jgi:hypothetical protein
MRVSRPLFDEISGEACKGTEAVADHARFISESFLRWLQEGEESEPEPAKGREGLVWMK